jgi:hypothetical protein
VQQQLINEEERTRRRRDKQRPCFTAPAAVSAAAAETLTILFVFLFTYERIPATVWFVLCYVTRQQATLRYSTNTRYTIIVFKIHLTTIRHYSAPHTLLCSTIDEHSNHAVAVDCKVGYFQPNKVIVFLQNENVCLFVFC